MSALPVAVLASGEGTNLQALIEGPGDRGLIELVAVASDKPDAPALARARAAGIDTRAFPGSEFTDRVERDTAIAEWLEGKGVELVISAGYMQLLDRSFIEKFRRRIINVHPSLLPRFPGIDAIGQALDAGVSETGVTVHFVDEGVDTGEVIASSVVPVASGMSREELEAAVHQAEHLLLPGIVEQISKGEIQIGDPPRG